MKQDDVKELQETVEMVKNEGMNQAVVAHLSFGDYVVLTEELFLKIVGEVNGANLKGGPRTEVIEDKDETK